jgi:hypothetical protein
VIFDAGLDDIMNVYFLGTTQVTTWYIGFISGSSFSGVSVGDTLTSHPTWTEYTDYSETTRPQITFGTVSSGTLNNPINVTITPNNAAQIAGWFLVSDNTKGGTIGFMPGGDQFDNGIRDVVANAVEQFNLVLMDRRQ